MFIRRTLPSTRYRAAPVSGAETVSMERHLAEISAAAPRAHAMGLLDRASGHTTAAPTIPDPLSLVLLPPASPELNPAENLWQCLRSTYLGNRIFQDYAHPVDCVCRAWRALLNAPGRIASIVHRDWACVG